MNTIALVGGRGYTGSALLALIDTHPELTLAFASSNSEAGQPIQAACPTWTGDELFIALSPEQVSAHTADVWVLAVPNGATQPWCDAIDTAHPDAIIVDLSADHRFDDTWAYGLPEHHRATIVASKRIANPGCYATAAQLALRPLVSQLAMPPHIFGVSGYSGAGKTPSPKNDPERLRDNLQPYHLVDHLHEREIGHQLGTSVRFMPHVAEFFRGISLTISLTLKHTAHEDTLFELFAEAYRHAPLVEVSKTIPEVQAIQHTPFASVGGFTVHNAHDVVLVATIDNLLKGAASQALQNINLCLGLPETLGIIN